MTTHRICPNCQCHMDSDWRCQICGSIFGFYPFEILVLSLLAVGAVLACWVTYLVLADDAPSALTPTVTPTSLFPTPTPALVVVSDFQLSYVPSAIDMFPSEQATVSEGSLTADDLEGRFILTTLQVSDNRLAFRAARGNPFRQYPAFVSSVANVTWNPQDRRFAVSGVEDNLRAIFVVEDGSYCQVTAQSEPVSLARWSPDGRTLAYLVDSRLFLTNADCAPSRNASELIVDGKVVTFDWSAIDVLALVLADDDRRDILFMDLRNGETRIMQLPEPIAGVYWNSQGTALVVVSGRQEQIVVLLHFVPGGVVSQTMIRTEVVDAVAWSPNGEALIIGIRAGGQTQLMHYTLNSKLLRPLTEFPEASSIDWTS